MRRLGYGLLLLAFASLLVFAGVRAWAAWQQWRGTGNASNGSLDERVLFEAPEGQALRFNAATHHGWAALQGFVVAPNEARRSTLPLTLEITLLDDDGRVVRREPRHLALQPISRARPYGWLPGGTPTPVWILPAQWVDLTDQPQVTAIGVRVLEAAPQIDATLWRGIIDLRLSEAETRLRYRRLGRAGRESLTDNWITPPSLIHPDLKRELVRHRQERIAPMGQPQVDFNLRRVLRQPAGSVHRTYRPRYHAIALSPELRVSLTTEAPQAVRIDTRAAGGGPMPFSLWRTDGASPVLALDVPGGRLNTTLPPGRFEFRSAQAGDIDVRDAVSGDPLVPGGVRRRTHLADTNRALTYPLFAVDGSVPPVRFSLRPADAAPRSAQLRFFDRTGRLIESHAIDVPWQPSLYDRRGDALDRAASDARQVELSPPPQASRVEVEAEGPVLVAASTALPESFRNPDAGRRWFSFLPHIDARDPRSQGVVVVEQPRAGVRAESRQSTPGAVDPPRRRAAEARPAEPPRPRLRLRPERAGADTED
ncbi:hypothetical protein ACFFGH_08880 [Lysobacter korlensis]|uniref:Uncharacterized protein n=1 Tax=Lysobacter korlensis TaxID=553636 RepID=A0ABV6RPX5_9GAMM